MKKFLILLFNFVFYSNLWIALGALVFCWQTQWILGETPSWNDTAAFVGCGTLFLYALHRTVGLSKVKQYINRGRYHIIYSFRYHIYLYAALGGIAAMFYFSRLNTPQQFTLVLSGMLALGYALPVAGNKRRLRDIHFVKIFLVALVWGIVTVLVPALAFQEISPGQIILQFLERTLFVFAITIPFDIRDYRIDKEAGVETLPHLMGIAGSKRLALVLLGIAALLVLGQWAAGWYTLNLAMALMLSLFLSAPVIANAKPEFHDYYYSGLMDGLILVQFGLVAISQVI